MFCKAWSTSYIFFNSAGQEHHCRLKINYYYNDICTYLTVELEITIAPLLLYTNKNLSSSGRLGREFGKIVKVQVKSVWRNTLLLQYWQWIWLHKCTKFYVCLFFSCLYLFYTYASWSDISTYQLHKFGSASWLSIMHDFCCSACSVSWMVFRNVSIMLTYRLL